MLDNLRQLDFLPQMCGTRIMSIDSRVAVKFHFILASQVRLAILNICLLWHSSSRYGFNFISLFNFFSPTERSELCLRWWRLIDLPLNSLWLIHSKTQKLHSWAAPQWKDLCVCANNEICSPCSTRRRDLFSACLKRLSLIRNSTLMILSWDGLCALKGEKQ